MLYINKYVNKKKLLFVLFIKCIYVYIYCIIVNWNFVFMVMYFCLFVEWGYL